MGDRIGHRPDLVRLDGLAPLEVELSGYAAHLVAIYLASSRWNDRERLSAARVESAAAPIATLVLR